MNLSDVKLSAVLVEKAAIPAWEIGNKSHTRFHHNKFLVTVQVAKRKTQFDFYGSINDFNNKVLELNTEGLLGAFGCFLSDASSGTMDFKEFCSEFGYDDDFFQEDKNNRNRANHAFRGCVSAHRKAMHIFTQEDFDAIYEEVR